MRLLQLTGGGLWCVCDVRWAGRSAKILVLVRKRHRASHDGPSFQHLSLTLALGIIGDGAGRPSAEADEGMVERLGERASNAAAQRVGCAQER